MTDIGELISDCIHIWLCELYQASMPLLLNSLSKLPLDGDLHPTVYVSVISHPCSKPSGSWKPIYPIDISRNPVTRHLTISGVVCHKIWKAGASNYIKLVFWDIITCPGPWCLLLSHHSWFSMYVCDCFYLINRKRRNNLRRIAFLEKSVNLVMVLHQHSQIFKFYLIHTDLNKSVQLTTPMS